MPSVVECAEMSRAAYSNQGDCEVQLLASSKVTWRRNPGPVNTAQMSTANGFYATLFQSSGGEWVLAYRGTDDLWDTVVDDVLHIAPGLMPPQAFAAINLARRFATFQNLHFTGHSLGGALALIAGAHLQRPAVTFNAPGVMDSCIMSAKLAPGVRSFFETIARCARGSRALNVRVDGDPVSTVFTTGLQVGGRQAALPSTCGFDLLCRHGIDTCVQAVRRKPENFKSLQL